MIDTAARADFAIRAIGAGWLLQFFDLKNFTAHTAGAAGFAWDIHIWVRSAYDRSQIRHHGEPRRGGN